MTEAVISPSVAALRSQFGSAILEAVVICGDTVVTVEPGQAKKILGWLKDDPSQQFNYLTDITAVEYRDPERPLEVVYQLRALARKEDLRLKIPLEPRGPLAVETVWDLWKGADWLEREVFDMFGIRFNGHPDLRRILMWETYDEGHPLRKNFPLRGHFSRAEQVRQSLAMKPESHYSLDELELAATSKRLPPEMEERLRSSERGNVE